MFYKGKLEFILYSKKPLQLYSKFLATETKPASYSYILRDIKKTQKTWNSEFPETAAKSFLFVYLFEAVCV